MITQCRRFSKNNNNNNNNLWMGFTIWGLQKSKKIKYHGLVLIEEFVRIVSVLKLRR